MNVVDCLIITILLLSALSGFRRGLLDAVSKIAGLAAGILAALYYCDDLARLAEEKFALAHLLSAKLETLPLAVNRLDNPLLQLVMPGLPAAHDARTWLVGVLITLICFLILLTFVSAAVTWLLKPLTGFFQHGLIGGVNRMAGLILITAKNGLILAVLLWLLFPVAEGLARLNISGAVAVYNCLQDSRILALLIDIFPRLKVFPGTGA